MPQYFSSVKNIPQKLGLGLIKAYKYVVSPWMGSCCRFEPSCSTYGQEALKLHGFIKGSWLTLIRVAKCGPFHEGGYDPVPQPKVCCKPQAKTKQNTTS